MEIEEIVKLITKMVIDKIKDLEIYKIPIGVSNRHIHVSQEDLDKLFGDGYRLTKKVDLKQPNQFAANETVTLRGPSGELENVRILGPVRNESQVEISITDSFRIGLKPPIRESGKLDNTPGIEIVGPKGSIKISQGTIVALRHIHITPNYAEKTGLKDKDIVEVETFGDRQGVLGNVLVRISENYSLEMHIDVDEANAYGLKNNDLVILRKI